MTSNQIDAARNRIEAESNRISEAHYKRQDINQHNANAETQRHNKSLEDLTKTSNAIEQQRANETERHNKSVEDLEAKSQQLESEKLQIERANTVLKATDSLLNDAYRSRVTRIQQQQAAIERQKLELDEQYKNTMLEITNQRTEIERQVAEENQRHNLNMEKFKMGELDISGYEAQTRRLNAEYNYRIGLESNSITRENVENRYSIDLLSLERDYAELTIRAEEAKANINAKDSESVKNYVQSVTSVLTSFGQILSGAKLLLVP